MLNRIFKQNKQFLLKLYLNNLSLNIKNIEN
jgi:hypothetical protein